MGDQLSRIFEIGIGAIALILAISLFIALNIQSSSMSQSYTQERLYTDNNTYTGYKNVITGGEAIYSIIEDTSSITFVIKNVTGTTLFTVTDCSNISDLSMVDKNKQYNISYVFENGSIRSIIYKEL